MTLNKRIKYNKTYGLSLIPVLIILFLLSLSTVGVVFLSKYALRGELAEKSALEFDDESFSTLIYAENLISSGNAYDNIKLYATSGVDYSVGTVTTAVLDNLSNNIKWNVTSGYSSNSSLEFAVFANQKSYTPATVGLFSNFGDYNVSIFTRSSSKKSNPSASDAYNLGYQESYHFPSINIIRSQFFLEAKFKSAVYPSYSQNPKAQEMFGDKGNQISQDVVNYDDAYYLVDIGDSCNTPAGAIPSEVANDTIKLCYAQVVGNAVQTFYRASIPNTVCPIFEDCKIADFWRKNDGDVNNSTVTLADDIPAMQYLFAVSGKGADKIYLWKMSESEVNLIAGNFTVINVKTANLDGGQNDTLVESAFFSRKKIPPPSGSEIDLLTAVVKTSSFGNINLNGWNMGGTLCLSDTGYSYKNVCDNTEDSYPEDSLVLTTVSNNPNNTTFYAMDNDNSGDFDAFFGANINGANLKLTFNSVRDDLDKTWINSHPPGYAVNKNANDSLSATYKLIGMSSTGNPYDVDIIFASPNERTVKFYYVKNYNDNANYSFSKRSVFFSNNPVSQIRQQFIAFGYVWIVHSQTSVGKSYLSVININNNNKGNLIDYDLGDNDTLIWFKSNNKKLTLITKTKEIDLPAPIENPFSRQSLHTFFYE